MENNFAEVRVNGTINPVDFDYNSGYQVCISQSMIRSEFFHGMWHGDNPFNSVLPITLLQIFLFLISSRLIYFLLRPIRTPKFVCSVLAGILLGPSVVGHNKKLKNLLFPPVQNEILRFMALMSSLYYIFIVMMKMEAVSNLKNALKTWKFGTIPFISSFWVMSGLLHFLVPSAPSEPDTLQLVRMLLCVTTSTSTFPVMSENLVELNLLTSELGQIAMSATALNEIANWAFLFTTAFLNFKVKGMENALGFMCSSIGFICFCVFVVRPTMVMIARRTPDGMPISQGHVVLMQIGVLAMGAVTNVLGLSILVGPLLMGMVMPHGSPLATTVVEKTEGIITHFLVPLYFCYVGLLIDAHSLQSWAMIFKFQLIIVAGFLTKFIACMLISLSYNIRLKHGIVLGLMLNFKGIIELIIFTKFRRFKMVDDQLFAHWVLSVIGVTAFVSPLIEILYKPLTRLETCSRSQTLAAKTRTIQNTPRNSELCIVSCVHTEGEVRSIIALLESINPSVENPICVYVIHLVELSGQSTPMLRRVDIKKKSLTHTSTGHIMRAFHNYARNSDDGSIALVPYLNVAPYKTMHESICNLAQDQSVPLIIIPFHQNDQSHVGGLGATIRKLNMDFLAHATCTVGILVDRQSHLRVSSFGSMSLRVGIFFVGGPDDREALALGMRMAEREKSSLEVFRFVVQNQEEEEEDLRMDERLIDEFRAMKVGRSGEVGYKEIKAEGTEVYDRMREVEGKYDLVMVGRKHRVEIGEMGDEEVLANMLDHAEMLGVMGEMLASKEFCDGKVPVLVTSCAANKLKGLGRKASSVAASHTSFGSRFW